MYLPRKIKIVFKPPVSEICFEKIFVIKNMETENIAKDVGIGKSNIPETLETSSTTKPERKKAQNNKQTKKLFTKLP